MNTVIALLSLAGVAAQFENIDRGGLWSIGMPMPDYLTETNATVEHEKTITIILSAYYGGDYWPAGPVLTKGPQVALDNLRSLGNWLPNYQVILELIDDECLDEPALQRLILKLTEDQQNHPNRFPLVLLTECADFAQRNSILIARANNLSTLAGFNANGDLNYRVERYPWFLGIGTPGDALYVAVAAFMRHMEWRKLAVISELIPFYDAADPVLLRSMEKDNISVAWMTKIRWDDLPSVAEEFASLKRSNLRIITSLSDSLGNLACWLAKFNIYGPNHIVFILSWSGLDVNASPPEPLADWCTKTMMTAVYPSFMPYGFMKTPEKGRFDSTGRALPEFRKQVAEKITDPIGDDYYPDAAPQYYDRVLATGLILNTTERLLKERRNETLSDWVVSTDNYRRYPAMIAELLLEAASLTRVRGVYGDYAIDRTTRLSTGYTPVSFDQISVAYNRKEDSYSAQYSTIGYYKSDGKRMVELTEPKWRTKTGRKPHDSLRVISLELDPIKPETAITLVSLSCCLVSALIIGAVLKCQRGMFKFSKLSFIDRFALIGHAIQVSSLMATPLSSKHLALSCNAFALLQACGFSLAQTSLLVNLLEIRSQAKAKKFSRQKKIEPSEKHRRNIAACLSWTLYGTILMLTLLLASPFKIGASELQTSMTYDESEMIAPFRYQCNLVVDVTSSCLLAFLSAPAAVQTMLAVFLSWQISSANGLRQFTAKSAVTYARSIPYIVLIEVAILVAIFTQPNDMHFVFICFSIITISFAAIHGFMLIKRYEETVSNRTNSTGKTVTSARLGQSTHATNT